MEFSKYQQDIFNWVKTGTGNLVIEAVAGSSKTTVMVESTKFLNKEKTVCFLAYNKSIAEELKKRVPAHINVSTFHALGWKAIKKSNPGAILDDNKVYNHIKNFFKENGIKYPDWGRKIKISNNIKKIIDLMRLNLMVDNVSFFQVEDLCEKFNIETLDKEGEFSRKIIKNVVNDETCYDFTDMIFVPIYKKLSFQKYDWIFVDEFQDASPIQQKIFLSSLKTNGRFVVVGDKCQPPGTIIDVLKTKSIGSNAVIYDKIPIEDVEIGSIVPTYSLYQGTFITTRDRVIGKSSRDYKGELIKITTDSGESSKYTPNHICIVNFKTISEKYCIYLMKRGNQFRIGQCRMSYKTKASKGIGAGPVLRMRAEGADAVWILEIYNTELESYVNEQYLSFHYGIPQTGFECPNKTPDDDSCQESYNLIWDKIPDNTDRGLKVLSDFKRELLYPINELIETPHISFRRPVTMRACNLISGASVLIFPGCSDPYKKIWQTFEVTREFYSGKVYSFDVENNHTYVADNILTHNCQSIYRFMGASAETFERIKEHPHTISLPLSICYRCGKNIVKWAKQLVPQIEHFEEKGDGRVLTNGSIKNVQDGDTVLCRVNFPLAVLAGEFLKQNKRVHINGKDIGKNLLKLLDNVDSDELAESWEFLDKKLKKLEIRLLKENDCVNPREQPEYFLLEDKIRTIKTLADGCNTKTQLEIKINLIFSDSKNESGITLSTIHSYKGREAKNVFIVEPQLIPFPFYLHIPGEAETEKNLDYVARTRAIEKLEYVKDWTAYGKD